MQEPENPESRDAIAYRLELVRQALTALNRAAIAQSIGMTPQAWSAYTTPKGNIRIDLDPALRLCRRYGVTLDWLYRGNWYGVPTDVRERLEKKASEWASKRHQSKKTA